jgi:hypothetical protein
MAKLEPLYKRDPLLFKVSMVYLAAAVVIILLHRLNLLDTQPLGMTIAIAIMAYSFFYVGRRLSKIDWPPKVSFGQFISDFLDDYMAGAYITMIILCFIPFIFLTFLSSLVKVGVL